MTTSAIDRLFTTYYLCNICDDSVEAGDREAHLALHTAGEVVTFLDSAPEEEALPEGLQQCAKINPEGVQCRKMAGHNGNHRFKGGSDQ